ncbi:hypothetical protein EVAR_84720_1 [Eumeta japonica]|uniref:Uncharacterized protein n=1 Tax=Eumeta variegata TaxID=151549 RepID=A0A4C1VQH5_EUMVA|nr:hypothetical protein EVAR_84720_1 [Eumeta japonica]
MIKICRRAPPVIPSGTHLSSAVRVIGPSQRFLRDQRVRPAPETKRSPPPMDTCNDRGITIESIVERQPSRWVLIASFRWYSIGKELTTVVLDAETAPCPQGCHGASKFACTKMPSQNLQRASMDGLMTKSI